MLKIILAALVCALGVSAFAQESTYQAPAQRGVDNVTKTGDVGLGVLLGTPMALNVKMWTQEDRAINANVAYQQGDLAIMGDYLWHFRRALAAPDKAASPITPYIGLGALVVWNVSDNTNDTENRPLYHRTSNDQGPGLGGRVPIGIEFLPQSFPAGFFAEIAPGAIFTPSNFSFLQAGAGARYYF